MKIEKSKSNGRKAVSKPARTGRGKTAGYSFTFRLKAVKLYLEEGYTAKVLSEERGIAASTLLRGVKVELI